MVLKRAKSDLNTVTLKLLFLLQNRKNHQQVGNLPLCDTLELQQFVQYGT